VSWSCTFWWRIEHFSLGQGFRERFGSACSELLVGDPTEIFVLAFSLFRSRFVLVLHILVENRAHI
jgi:hypothetical protein